MVNMDRHRCKLCSRRFSSGRALGGHMRSHLATLPLPPKTPQKQKEVNYSDFVAVGTNNGGGGDAGGGGGGTTETCTESTSSECFEEEQEAKADETESEVEKGLVYGLRENPKKSFRLVDPEFLDDPSVVQDRESETESTRKPTRRRSKRTRRMLAAKAVDHVVVDDDDDDDDDDDVVVEKVQDMIINKPSSTESLVVELEPVSSVSDTSPEEDLALCLIMLSRDVWSSSTTFSDNSEVLKLSQTHNTKFKFRCEICNRVFASSQALGSHRTSHVNKKIKMNFSPPESNYNEGESKQQQQFIKSNNNGVIKNADKKVHECPFCGKVFGSGQALGGHKRSHLMSSSTTTTNTTTPSFSSKPGDSLVDSNSAKIQDALMIDLNLPAPMEEEGQDGGFFCLQEVSALSDSVFINPIKH